MLVTWLDMREIEGMLFLIRFEYRILTENVFIPSGTKLNECLI